ncbi:MAG: ABC transporter ATP-binding protein, partial [Mesorhizobium sp.]
MLRAPPLSCRTSPPRGSHEGEIGRDRRPWPTLQHCRTSGALKPPISLLVGEMSGRTEGGAVP